jgi:hypothetical protein
MLDPPAFDFAPASFFGFFFSRLDLCCPLAMVTLLIKIGRAQINGSADLSPREIAKPAVVRAA